VQAAVISTSPVSGFRPSTCGFFLRVAIVGIVFLASAFYAVDTLVSALGGFEVSHSPPPSLSDAGWGLLLAGLQLVMTASAVVAHRNRRPTRMGRLRAVTWWLVAFDIVLVFVVLTTVGLATI
jgi:hypothetical protein